MDVLVMHIRDFKHLITLSHPQSFLARPAEVVAPELIGSLLVKCQASVELMWGVIVEMQAYHLEERHAISASSASRNCYSGMASKIYILVMNQTLFVMLLASVLFPISHSLAQSNQQIQQQGRQMEQMQRALEQQSNRRMESQRRRAAECRLEGPSSPECRPAASW